jgi:hypothetical protein
MTRRREPNGQQSIAAMVRTMSRIWLASRPGMVSQALSGTYCVGLGDDVPAAFHLGRSPGTEEGCMRVFSGILWLA